MGEYSQKSRRWRHSSSLIHEQDRAGSLPTGAPQVLFNLAPDQGPPTGRASTFSVRQRTLGASPPREGGASSRVRGVRGGGARGAGRGTADSETKTPMPPFVLPWKLGSHAESDAQGDSRNEVGVNHDFQQLLAQKQSSDVAAESLDPLRGRLSSPQAEQAQKPFKILKVGVQYRFKGDAKRHASEQEQILLAPVYIRILGAKDPLTPISYENISFVAKDLCVLLQMSKSEVRRTVGDYRSTEKKIIPVICSHNNGSASVHMLLCLTPLGIQRLLTESTFHLAAQVMTWAFDHIKHLCG